MTPIFNRIVRGVNIFTCLAGCTGFLVDINAKIRIIPASVSPSPMLDPPFGGTLSNRHNSEVWQAIGICIRIIFINWLGYIFNKITPIFEGLDESPSPMCTEVTTNREWISVRVNNVIDSVFGFISLVAVARSDWLFTIDPLVTWPTFAFEAIVMYECRGITRDTCSTILTWLGRQTTVCVFKTAFPNITRSSLQHCYKKDNGSYRQSSIYARLEKSDLCVVCIVHSDVARALIGTCTIKY